MTKAEARARFYARAALAGDPPVSMMAVPHKTEMKMAETYWVLKCSDDSGLYLSSDEHGVAFTTSRKDATRYPSRKKAQGAQRDLNVWSLRIRRVRKRLPPLTSAKGAYVRDALGILDDVETSIAAIRRCLVAESPGFPLYTVDLANAAIAIGRCAAAFNALAAEEARR